MKKELSYAFLFEEDSNVPPQEQARVFHAIHDIGGLTFRVERSEEGWTAQCNEVTGIIAGDTNSNPKDSDLELGIRNAILCAFDVRSGKKKPVLDDTNAFKYSMEKTVTVSY